VSARPPSSKPYSQNVLDTLKRRKSQLVRRTEGGAIVKPGGDDTAPMNSRGGRRRPPVKTAHVVHVTNVVEAYINRRRRQ